MSIEQLAARVAAIPANRRGHRHYDKALKRELMLALASSELSRDEFGRRVGVSPINLSRWRGMKVRGRRAKNSAASFKPVVVEPERGERLRVRAASGVVIEDLSVEAVADLLVALATRASC